MRAMLQSTSKYRRHKSRQRRSCVDDEVENSKVDGYHPQIVRSELVSTEGRDARLDPAGADRNDRQTDEVEVSAGSDHGNFGKM